MPLDHLVVCRCGHDIEQHGADGCTMSRGGERCTCRLPREDVIDSALNAERDEIRRQWLPDRSEERSR
jgi:hypothetical protein